MVTDLLKTNLEARSVSLSSGLSNLALFGDEKVNAQGIYLNPRQSYENTTDGQKVVILHVFQGVADFELSQEGQELFKTEISRSDILVLPKNSSYKISNYNKSNFIASELVVQR
ncbi:hypothetical protein JST56_05635 [Candidatus Dependentiae bacterium]|nr:hypothetical protein [Candidatus Dependentiae bacterium]